MIKKFFISFFLSLFLLFSPTNATAADISIVENSIVISGEIIQGDHDKLVELYNNSDIEINDVILTNSRGGNFFDAMKMAMDINGVGLDTVTLGRCWSACVYIWLGGVNKYIHSNDDVKIHAPYLIDEYKVTLTPEEIDEIEREARDLLFYLFGYVNIPHNIGKEFADATGDKLVKISPEYIVINHFPAIILPPVQ